MKKVLLALIALVVVALAALFLVPPMIANSVIKPQITAAIEDATGRKAEIADLELGLFPSISLQMSGLEIANAEGMPTPTMVSVGSADLQVALFPLFGRSVAVERLVVSDLAVSLAVAEDGRQNWVFEPRAGGEAPAPQGAGGAEGGLPISDLSLGDVRIERARLSFIDQRTGQTIEADDLNLKAKLPGLAGALALDGDATVNDQAIELALEVDSPAALLSQGPATLVAKIQSALIAVDSDLALRQKPQPAVDGSAKLEVGSVGALLDWLQMPLPADQPDPGPLNLAAEFKTEGQKVVLEQAVISGDALDARASGSFEQQGEKTVAFLKLESGVLDIDRYLPPPAPGEAAPKQVREPGPGAKPVNPLDAISDEPIDLAPLRNVDADIEIAIGGIKAAGYEVGEIAFNAKMTGGKLAADLTRLALYGGGVTGKLALDASGEALGLESDFAVDKVDLGKLAAVGVAGEPPVAGIASGSLTAKASGASPRALVQGLQGGLRFQLGKIDVKTAAAAALSGVDITLDLPGIANPPSLKGQLVYNKQQVALDVGLDPLDKVLAGETFNLKANLVSKLLEVSYDGLVQQQPLPGLDGRFDLDSPSVGKLAAWLGQPLDKSQPDPGPLKVAAVLKAEGQKVELQEARIQGKALDAVASGSVDIGGDVKKIALDVKAGKLDIDAYLPRPEKMNGAAATAPAATDMAAKAGNPLQAISDEPIDLAALQGTEADAKVALAGLRVQGFELGQTDVNVGLKGGKLVLDIPGIALYSGGISGRVDLDGSGDDLDLAADLKVASLAVGALAQAAGVEPAPLSGVVTANLKARARGKSPRALVQALSAELGLQLANAKLAALPDAEIGQLDGSLSMPAMAQPTKGTVKLTLNGQPLDLGIDVNSPNKALAGETFDLKLAVTSALLKANVDGAVQQQPVPGLNGEVAVDVTSVGELAAWLGQPLPEGQPDPGPVMVRASLTADGAKVALKEATLAGRESGGKPAAKARASGSFDGSGEIVRFDGKLDVERLDLNAYLPPPKEQAEKPSAAAKAPAAQEGWSEEPIDASALRQAMGGISVTTGEVLYRNLQIQKAVADVKLDGGVLNVTVNELLLSPGRMTAAAVLDGSGKDVGLSYNADISGVESKPFLNSFAGIDWLSGKLNLQTKGVARGINQKQIVSSLNGDGAVEFLDGAIEGFDLPGTLRKAGQLGMAAKDEERPKTDFTELSGTFTVTDGLVQNRDLKMLSPLVRLSGAGDVPLPPRTVDYTLEAKLVASLEGQGGQEALAGIPIPVHVHGPWSGLAYDIDWASVFTKAALDPSRVANMPADMKDAAKNLGVALPGLGGEAGTEGLGGAVGGALEGVLGGKKTDGETESGADQGVPVLKNLLGGGAQQPAAPAPAPEEPAPSTKVVPIEPAPAPQEEETKPKVQDLLKKLF